MDGRSSYAIARSLARYVYSALGDPWSVALADDEGTFERPAGFVFSAAEAETSGGTHHFDVAQPFSIVLYPEPAADSHASWQLAEAARERLVVAFRSGAAEGYPLRVPLWDYEGVPADEVATPRRVYSGRRARRDHGNFARVREFRSRAEPDETDPQLYKVTATARLAWRRRAFVDPHNPLAEGLNLHATPH